MKTRIITWIGMAVAASAWAGAPAAWATTAAETQSAIDFGEVILSSLRTFLAAVKENVTELGETEFKFGAENRKALAEESSRSITLNGATYETTHKLTISNNGSLEVIADLGKTDSGSFVGEVAVYMGNASAQLTVKYLLPPDTNVGAQIEVVTAEGWTFKREESGVIHCSDPSGGHQTSNGGVTCVFSGQELSDEDIRAMQDRIDAGESYQSVAASYGGTCS